MSNQQTEQEALVSLLANHYGSVSYFAYPLGLMRYTDGVKCFADNAGGGAYWLLDILGTEPSIKGVVMGKGFACATLSVSADSKATLIVIEDDGIPPAYERSIPYTTCPEGDWKFFMVATEDEHDKPVFMCMLPSEY